MPAFRELSALQKFWELVRWLLILPAAVVAQLIVRLALGILLQSGLVCWVYRLSTMHFRRSAVSWCIVFRPAPACWLGCTRLPVSGEVWRWDCWAC